MFINNQGKFCMKINQVKNNINFNSGYNLNIAKMERQINPINTELFFKNSKLKDWGTFYNIDFNVINRGYFNAFRHKPSEAEYLPQIQNGTPNVSTLNCVIEVEFYAKQLNVRR